MRAASSMLRSIVSVNGGSSCPFRFCTRVSPCPGGCLGSHAEPRRSPDVTQRSAQSASDRRWPTWCILSLAEPLLGDLVGPAWAPRGVAFSRHSAGSQNLLVGPPQRRRRPAKPTTHSSKHGTSPIEYYSALPDSERVGGALAWRLRMCECVQFVETRRECVNGVCVCRAIEHGDGHGAGIGFLHASWYAMARRGAELRASACC